MILVLVLKKKPVIIVMKDAGVKEPEGRVRQPPRIANIRFPLLLMSDGNRGFAL